MEREVVSGAGSIEKADASLNLAVVELMDWIYQLLDILFFLIFIHAHIRIKATLLSWWPFISPIAQTRLTLSNISILQWEPDTGAGDRSLDVIDVVCGK